jgi:HlyD family secretion protein
VTSSKHSATKRVLRSLLGLSAVALVATLIYLAMRPQPQLVDTAEVVRGALRVTVDEDGVTRIKERYIVSTPLAGRLERIHLEAGDEVSAHSTILARMQPTDPELLDPRAVAQAEARVKAAERRLEVTKAELTKAEAAQEFAQLELKRAEKLVNDNAISSTAFEEKQLANRLRTEEVRSAQFGVEIAEYELKLERSALLLTRPSGTDESPGDREMQLEVRAPINGRVLRVHQESSAVLSAGASLMEIGDPSDLEVVVDVLSSDAVRVSPGAEVVLENWGGAAPLRGQVRTIEPSGFTKLSALGVEEQRVNVIVELLDSADQRRNLGDGYRVDARIVVWEEDDVLKIPASALFRIEEDWHVFAVRGATAKQVSVEIGQNNGIEAQVVSGLRRNEEVVVHPSDQLSDGTMIEKRN